MSLPKTLVVGCGSIGLRHLRNLKSLGAGDLRVFDSDPARAAVAAREFGAQAFSSLEEALGSGPDLAVIATPSSLHLQPALAAARSDCHLFIEKPLSHTLDGVDELIAEVDRRSLTALVGCNMRFHPGVRELMRVAASGVLGPIRHARIWAGSYLPDWRPGRDYRRDYSARKDLGGGALLDFVHELDYLIALLGRPIEASCTAATLGGLGIETEDCADLLVRFSGAAANVHLDYLDRSAARGCALIGDAASAEWRSGSDRVRVVGAHAEQAREIPADASDVNAMYVDELRHLLRCIDGVESPAQDLRSARLALALALAAKESAASGRPARVASEGATVAVIQARMNSSRLPGKVLRTLGGETVLGRLIGSLKRARSVDRIVVATSDQAADDPVAKAARSAGVSVFRGSELDVLDRVYQAARFYRAEAVVRMTADCPLADPAVIDRVVAAFRDGRPRGVDYAATGLSYPDGLDVEVASFEALEAAWREAELSSEREHVLPFIWKRPERFGVLRVEFERDLRGLRLTLDEERDFALLEAVFGSLGPSFTLADVLRLLEERPELSKLNSGITRNAGYAKSLEEDAQASGGKP